MFCRIFFVLSKNLRIPAVSQGRVSCTVQQHVKRSKTDTTKDFFLFFNNFLQLSSRLRTINTIIIPFDKKFEIQKFGLMLLSWTKNKK